MNCNSLSARYYFYIVRFTINLYMISLNRIIFPLFIILSFTVYSTAQELKINELMSSNRNVVYDEDGDSPDWLEIINTGSSGIYMGDYYLSDDVSIPLMWQLPDMELQAGETMLIFASGKDRWQTNLSRYTFIDKGDTWNYILPETEPSGNWKTVGFDDSSWDSGASGIGYSDGDDATIIPATLSVFMRKSVVIPNVDAVEEMWLHIDFDDAFVAYLNGTEIARQGIGQPGEAVPFDKKADVGHEAMIFNGEAPEQFDISGFNNLLVEGENVLAVQVHNWDITSSDLTAIPFLTLGYSHPIESDKTLSEYIQLPSQNSHTNFKLSASGETLFLCHSNEGIVDSVSFGTIPVESSFGRDRYDLSKWGYFMVPTPGIPNETPITYEIVENRVSFSIDEMFISGYKELVLSGAETNEEIRYTTNGEEPNLNSPVYKNPITINKNMVVRARIFKPGAVPGYSSTRTYLTDSRPTLPVVAVSTDPDNLWDNENGIYVLGDSYEPDVPYFGANFWEEWEKPAGIEMTGTQGERIFSLNCGIKIFGGWSRANEQKSLSVFFRNEYGDPELKNVQLFDSKPINDFKSFVLRNGGNDCELGKIRDGMMTSLVREMDIDLQAYQPTIMYLNGEYWGIINLREKVNEDFIESNHDVDADEIDLLEGNASVVEGRNEDYLALISFIKNNNISEDAVYERVAQKMDINNFIDYQLSQIYFNNRDWPGNNIKYWRQQNDDGKWRWILYDTDFGFGIYNNKDYELNTLEFATATDGQSWPNPPWSTFLFRTLLENTTFRNRFVNRFADALNTTFKPDRVIRHIDSLAADIRPEIPRHNEKWETLWPTSWEQNVTNMRNFARYRVSFTREHIIQQFSLPAHHYVQVDFSSFGSGMVHLNSIDITESGWNGRYFQAVPIRLTAQAYAGYQFQRWEVNGAPLYDETIEIDVKQSTNIRAVFEDNGDDGNSVVFNEINYNSADEHDAGDWVEIYNWGRFDLDISEWVFKDSDDEHEFVIPENTILASKSFLVFCADINKFNQVHPSVTNYIGEFDFGLKSEGDRVRLYDELEQLVDQVAFADAYPWAEEPDGNGPTLELKHYGLENALAENWKASVTDLGTPGKVNSVADGSDWDSDTVSKRRLSVYPNPFREKIHFQLDSYDYESMDLQVFTIDGQAVYNESTYSNRITWKGQSITGQKLKPGIYICKVRLGDQIFTSKVILSE